MVMVTLRRWCCCSVLCQLPCVSRWNTTRGFLQNKQCIAVIFIFFLLSLGISLPMWKFNERHFLQHRSEMSEEEDFRLTTADQVHLSLGPGHDEVTVIWATKAFTKSWIVYGHDTESLNKKVPGKVEYINYRNLLGTPYWHHVVLSGLLPGTVYFYRIKSGRHISRPFRFTALAHGHQWSPRFIVYGNLGIKAKHFKNIIKQGRRGQFNAVLHLGDIAYELGKDQGDSGDYFLQWIEDLAAEVPYMTCPGDEDISFQAWQYSFRFAMPASSWPMNPNTLWYSYDVGNVHLVSLSTEVFLKSPYWLAWDQLDWLLQDLQQANMNRAHTPWIIVMGHHPLYCSLTDLKDCININSGVCNTFEDMIFAYGVDLYLSSHPHLYERTWPVFQGSPISNDYKDPHATVSVITGSMGNQYESDPMDTSSQNLWSARLISKKDWESFGQLTVLNKTHLVYEETLAKSSKVIDRFVIQQRHHGPFGDVDVFKEKYLSQRSLFHRYIPRYQLFLLLIILVFILCSLWKKTGVIVNPTLVYRAMNLQVGGGKVIRLEHI